MYVLQTQRLALREMTPSDAPFIVELLTDPAFLANIGDRGVRDLDTAAAYIARWRDTYARDGFGLWVVELRDSREPIGMCGLVKRDTLPGPDIGYALLPRYWSRGYAVEACTAVRDYAVQRLGLDELLAIVSPGNAASVKVLERIGLQFRRNVQLGGDSEYLLLYSLNG
jgi:[ribosomal protein S5]-alanine N-acetyltransferase